MLPSPSATRVHFRELPVENQSSVHAIDAPIVATAGRYYSQVSVQQRTATLKLVEFGGAGQVGDVRGSLDDHVVSRCDPAHPSCHQFDVPGHRRTAVSGLSRGPLCPKDT